MTEVFGRERRSDSMRASQISGGEKTLKVGGTALLLLFFFFIKLQSASQ